MSSSRRPRPARTAATPHTVHDAYAPEKKGGVQHGEHVPAIAEAHCDLGRGHALLPYVVGRAIRTREERMSMRRKLSVVGASVAVLTACLLASVLVGLSAAQPAGTSQSVT